MGIFVDKVLSLKTCINKFLLPVVSAVPKSKAYFGNSAVCLQVKMHHKDRL